MDEETFYKISLGVCLLILLLSFMTVMTLKNTNVILKGATSNCGQVIDVIYEQCSEEGNINLTSMKGRSKNLEYTNGVCVIK